MNQSNSSNRSMNKTVPFEWTQYEHGSDLNEFGDPEIIDVTHDCHAKVVEPELGKMIEGQVLVWRLEHEGCCYAIVEEMGRYLAICTEVECWPYTNKYYRLRSVALEEPKGQRVWEVLRLNGVGIWEPVEGQHLHSRTALAEQWLLDIGPALASLSMKRKQLLADKRALAPEQSNRIGAWPVHSGIRGGSTPSSGDLRLENAAMHDPKEFRSE